MAAGNTVRWARVGVAWLLLGAASAAWAANVDLTVAINVPTTTTLQPFAYTVVVGNAQTGSVATGSQLSIPLPANLYNVSVQSVVSSGPAATACPAPASFSGVPAAGTVTSGGEVLSAVIPNLPATGFCTVTVAATPLAANSYTMNASVAAGAGDTEIAAGTNSATGNTATALSVVPLKVDKTIVTGATRIGTTDQWNAAGYNQDIVYELRFENQSALDLPLGAMGDAWADWEGNWAPQSTPASSTLTNLTCAAGPCPPLTIGTVAAGQGTNLTPFTANMTGYVLPAGQTVVIRYTRRYAPPVCGQAQIGNDITWQVNQTGNYITPQWQPNSYSATGSQTSRSVLNFPAAGVPACVGLAIQPVLGKTLDSVTSADGSVTRANFGVIADGDRANFTITINNTATDATGWPAPALAAGAQNVPFSIWDVVRSVLGEAVSPTVYPEGAATQEVVFEGCSVAGSGSVCPAIAVGTVLKAASTDFHHGQYAEMQVAAGQTMTLRFSTRYKFNQSVVCVRNNAQIENYVSLTTQAAPNGYAYSGPLYQEVVTTGKVSLLPPMPRCADVSANKTMSPSNPASGDPITFTLDYVNSTSLATANPYNAPTPLTDVGVSDVLGSNFTPTAVSCSVLSGTAVAPVVTLAEITGPDHTFATSIPSMADGAVVRCQITGSVNLPGSYRNVTAVALAANSGLLDPYTANNLSALNYGIIGPRVQLTKSASLTGNTVAYVVTARSSGEVAASNTRVTDALPAGVSGATWTCAAAGGAVCPAASGSGNIDQVIATFPSGGSVTWTITATMAPSATATTITNTAQATPPPGSSCVTANPSDPPTAPPCVATAAVAAPVAPQVAVSTAFVPGATISPGGTVGYTVTFSNSGAVAADGAQISDPLPGGVASQTWTCVATGGAVCPAASGSGPIGGTVATLPAGGSLTYTVTATLTGNPPATITNQATITPPAGGVCASGSVAPCTASASITGTAGSGSVTAVPMDAPWALTLLAVLIGIGAARQRRSAPHAG